MPKLPDHFADHRRGRTATQPFRLVAAPARKFLNTTFTETPGRASARAGRRRWSTPRTRRGSASTEGGRVRLGNARGEVVVHARSCRRRCSPAS